MARVRDEYGRNNKIACEENPRVGTYNLDSDQCLLTSN